MLATTLTNTSVAVSTTAVRLDVDAFQYPPDVPFTAKNTGTVPLTIGRTSGVTVGATGSQVVLPGETFSTVMLADSPPVYGIASAATTVTTVQTSDFSGAAGAYVAGDESYLAWTGDYQFLQAALTPTAGTLYLARLKLRRPATIAKVGFTYATAAANAAGTYVALYDTAGNQLGVSADASTAFSTTTGPKSASLTTPYVALAGDYVAAFLINSADTVPHLGIFGTSAVLNHGKTGFNARYATGPTGNTTTAPAATYTTPTASANAIFAFVS